MNGQTIRVAVTAEDIAAGVPYDGAHCPVALALSRTLLMPYTVMRSKQDGHWVGIARMRGLGAEFRLSRAVGEFTIRFDDRLPVKPFAFRVAR